MDINITNRIIDMVFTCLPHLIFLKCYFINGNIITNIQFKNNFSPHFPPSCIFPYLIQPSISPESDQVWNLLKPHKYGLQFKLITQKSILHKPCQTDYIVDKTI